MKDRFKNAVDALVYSFFNDTLAKMSCASCAVGNMVAWSHGYKKQNISDSCAIIGTYFSSYDWTEAVWNGYEDDDEILVISKTGYSAKELYRVEEAFEHATEISYLDYHSHSKSVIMQDQYNGLMAVLEVLCEIEGIEDPSEYKELFAIS